MVMANVALFWAVLSVVIGCYWPALLLAVNRPIGALIPTAHLCLLPVTEKQKSDLSLEWLI